MTATAFDHLGSPRLRRRAPASTRARLARRRPPHRQRRGHRPPAEPATRSSPARRSTRTRRSPASAPAFIEHVWKRDGVEVLRQLHADRRRALLAHLVVPPPRGRRLHGRGLRARRPAPRIADRSPPSNPRPRTKETAMERLQATLQADRNQDLRVRPRRRRRGRARPHRDLRQPARAPAAGGRRAGRRRRCCWCCARRCRSSPPGEVGVRINRLTGGVARASPRGRRWCCRCCTSCGATRCATRSTGRPRSATRRRARRRSRPSRGCRSASSVTVRYALDRDRVGEVAKRLPANVGHELIEPVVDGVLHRALAKHTVREIFTDKRVEIQDDIEQELRGAARQGRHRACARCSSATSICRRSTAPGSRGCWPRSWPPRRCATRCSSRRSR